MEWTITIMITVLLLGIGYLTASSTIEFSKTIQHRSGKIATWTLAVLLPLLLLIAVWIYNGIAVCSYCKSITINTYTPANWIVDVNICRDCVEYVDVCNYCVRYADSETAKLFKKPDKNSITQHICRTCDGDINMRDDELGESFVLAALILINIGHWATLFVSGIMWLVKNRKKRK